MVDYKDYRKLPRLKKSTFVKMKCDCGQVFKCSRQGHLTSAENTQCYEKRHCLCPTCYIGGNSLGYIKKDIAMRWYLARCWGIYTDQEISLLILTNKLRGRRT